MANLNSWQKITRVLPGQPFGNGADGALTISADTTQSPTDESCSGTADSTSLTCASTSLTNNDVLLIHQTRGTGAGQWEINRVLSGGGTTSITLQTALHYTFTDSGASQAQAIKIPQYTNVTVNSGKTWTAKAWGGDVGGILVFACKGILTITGNILGTGKGYVGAVSSWSGEGYVASGITQSSSANGNGGGGGNGGDANYPGCGGGGGGNGTTGTSGSMPSSVSGSPVPGVGGSVSGSADGITLIPGGAAGGGKSTSGSGVGGSGGSGGSVILIFTKQIAEITGTIISGGGAGQNGTTGDAVAGDGGGGAGGSVLIVCQIAVIGTSKITTPAGTGTTGGGAGGIGGVGRIAVHHSDTITGTTTPSFTDVEDSTLIESSGAFIFNLV